jgi:metal-responsive CopG/Arc/MetJ family transcriptional regulator
MERTHIQITLDPSLVERLDAERGETRRSEYIGRAIRQAIGERESDLIERASVIEALLGISQRNPNRVDQRDIQPERYLTRRRESPRQRPTDSRTTIKWTCDG